MTDAVVVAAPHTDSVTTRLAVLLPGLSAAVVVLGLGLADGGYFATAWGPVTLVFLVLAGLALALQPTPNLGARELALPGLFAALGLWTLASAAWGLPSEAVPEAQRTLVYVAGAFLIAVVLRRDSVASLLIGVWAGVSAVCVYAVSTRLFPEQLGVFDPIAGYRLSEPVGYWNALGLLAALGTILAFGLAARAERLLIRTLAAAATVPLLLTLYFTFSRGAWLALAAGLVLALALDPRRLQLGFTVAVVGTWPALAVVIASTSGPLTETGFTMAAASADGQALAAIGIGLTLAAAAALVFVAALESRLRFSAAVHRSGAIAFAAACVACLAVGVVVLGGPAKIARSFDTSSSARVEDLNTRLFNLSGSGRVDGWRVALDDVAGNPVLGSGAGSYKREWLQHRPYAARVRDAHSLYVEMLAELGPMGLALVGAIFGLPLVLAIRVRRRPLVPVAAGALFAFGVHAGIDWDWEFPVLTLVALACAGAIVAERLDASAIPPKWRRLPLLVAVLALIPVVALGALGARAMAASANAFDHDDYTRAASEAESAERLAPWSVEPLVLLGRAQAAAGDHAAARVTFRRAVAREPEYWRPWLELAAVSRGAQRKTALRRARALNPLEDQVRELEEGP